MLVSGTRDLLLSQVVLMHRKLRKAGVHAELHLAEESQDILTEMARFLDTQPGS